MPMKNLSLKSKFLKEALTLKINEKAQFLKKEGKKVYFFSIGDPDFSTPEEIKNRGIEAIKNNFTKYTAGAGILPLREEISKDIEKRLGIKYKPEEIVVTVGGKFAIASSILAICDKDDEVIILSPYFPSYLEMVYIAGGVPKIIKLKEKERFVLKPEILEKSIGKKTKALLLNSPHNPTGVVLRKDELKEISKICEKKDIFIISDEVYSQLLFDGKEHFSIASFKEAFKRTFLIDSFSKTYCMTGWRVGYCAAPLKLSKTVSAIQSHMNSSTSAISQYAALYALKMENKKLKEMLKSFEERRDIMVESLNKIENISFIKPEGAFYIFINVKNYLKGNKKSFDLSLYLLENFGVATMPGSSFGMEGYIRLSFAVSKEDIIEGVKKLKEGLNCSLKP